MGRTGAKILMLIAAFLSAFFISSCDKDGEQGFPENQSVFYQTEENFEMTFGTVNAIANAAMRYAESITYAKVAEEEELACANIDFEGTKEMGRVEVDFGAQGCKGPDGRTRKGKVIVEYSGKKIFYGSVVYATFSEFYLEQYKIEGTLKSENISTNPDKPVFRVTITGAKLIWPDQSYAIWQTNRTHTWTFSNNLQSIQLSIAGTSSGRTRAYDEFFSETLEPLVFKSECTTAGNYVPIKGLKKISLATEDDLLVDYGLGDCDRIITVVINDRSLDITL